MLGAMTIPSLLMVLGANLARGPGVAAGRLPAAAVAAACACRLVAMPLLGSAIVMAAHAAGAYRGPEPEGSLANNMPAGASCTSQCRC